MNKGIKKYLFEPSYNVLQVASVLVILFNILKQQAAGAVFFGVLFLFATFYKLKEDEKDV